MAVKLEDFTPLISVFDMPRSVAFYQNALGFEVVNQSEPGNDFDWCMLRRDDIVLMLNTTYERHERPENPDPARVIAHDDTMLFFGCRDLDAACTHLRSQGIEVKGPKIASYGMRQLWLKDPDAYVICLQWPAT